MSNVKKHVTEAQKEVKDMIQLKNETFIDDYEDEYEDGPLIPQFVKDMASKKKDEVEVLVDPELTSPLLNVPGNSEIEEQKHLDELELMCQNWSEAEWKRVVIHASSKLMTAELERRLVIFEKFVTNQRSNIDALSGQKL